MSQPSFNDLCRQLCRELQAPLPPLSPTAEGHSTFSMVIDGIPVTIAHAPSHAPDRLLILAELGAVPHGREHEAHLSALDANLRLQGAHPLSIGRSPDSDMLVLQMARPIASLDAIAVLGDLMAIAGAAREWRAEGCPADLTALAESLASLQPEAAEAGMAHEFRSLCSALCEAAALPVPEAGDLPDGTQAMEINLRGVRMILSHGPHTGPGHLQVLATFGALPADRTPEAARRLLELNAQVLGLGFAFARHPWNGDILLRQAMPLPGTTGVELLQRLGEIAEGIEGWQSHHFLPSNTPARTAMH